MCGTVARCRDLRRTARHRVLVGWRSPTTVDEAINRYLDDAGIPVKSMDVVYEVVV
ncbi:hypothetical protein [Mycobacteroides abscessus]|uniref:hypothetical protein n=1 Tax=Mycobacteroides abscessus TaxID=36809 RepID=UPI001877DB93